jgi:hypothetical protein
VLYAFYAIVQRLRGGTVQGWTATIVLVSLFASAQLLMTGILGEYIGRIYEQVKLRPLYIVADRVNLPASPDTDEIDEVDARSMLPQQPPREVAVALDSKAIPHLAPPTPRPASRPPPPAAPSGLARPSTLLGVPPSQPPPAPFPAVPQTSTVVMPVLPSKEGAELARAAELEGTAAAPKGVVDVPPPPTYLSALLQPVSSGSSRPPPPLPKRVDSQKPSPPRSKPPLPKK